MSQEKTHNYYTRSKKHRTFGGVMAETVLIMPLVLVIFALVVFFGLSMLRTERTSIMDRYIVWKEAYRAPGPETVEDLNNAFLGGDADKIEYRTSQEPANRPLMALQNAVKERSRTTYEYTNEMLEDFPSQIKFVFKTSYNTGIPFFEWLGTWHKHGHERVDNEWKFVNVPVLNEYDKWTYGNEEKVSPEFVQTDYFWSWYDSALVQCIRNDNEYAMIFREFHHSRPTYRGPMVVPEDWQLSTN
ncbi:pilus assembly protein [Planctomycetota bacterium]|nr:pilus assembly protein [Planctomycetota bacterium]